MSHLYSYNAVFTCIDYCRYTVDDDDDCGIIKQWSMCIWYTIGAFFINIRISIFALGLGLGLEKF